MQKNEMMQRPEKYDPSGEEAENPRCGSQGVDDDGLCVRCGLVPSDAADLDADANNCPPGFLTRPVATPARMSRSEELLRYPWRLGE